MMIAQPRFAITGYDHGMFFIQGLKKQGARSSTGERPAGELSACADSTAFREDQKGWIQEQDSFQLIHYTFQSSDRVGELLGTGSFL